MKILLIFSLILTSQLICAQSITSAWVKRPIPGMKLTGAYMLITNNTAKKLTLVNVTGADADYYEIHTHEKIDGVMKMRQLKQLEIPIGKSVELKPKSYHIMLIQIKKGSLNPGTKKTELTLHFLEDDSKKKSMKVSAEVRKS